MAGKYELGPAAKLIWYPVKYGYLYLAPLFGSIALLYALFSLATLAQIRSEVQQPSEALAFWGQINVALCQIEQGKTFDENVALALTTATPYNDNSKATKNILDSYYSAVKQLSESSPLQPKEYIALQGRLAEAANKALDAQLGNGASVARRLFAESMTLEPALGILSSSVEAVDGALGASAPNAKAFVDLFSGWSKIEEYRSPWRAEMLTPLLGSNAYVRMKNVHGWARSLLASVFPSERRNIGMMVDSTLDLLALHWLLEGMEANSLSAKAASGEAWEHCIASEAAAALPLLQKVIVN